jgi:hypothetical protein
MLLNDPLKLTQMVCITEHMQTLLVLKVRFPVVMTCDSSEAREDANSIHSLFAAFGVRCVLHRSGNLCRKLSNIPLAIFIYEDLGSILGNLR